MRRYEIVRLVDGPRMRWAVVSRSLRGDDTWDVIESCFTRAQAEGYVDEVTERNRALEAAGCP